MTIRWTWGWTTGRWRWEWGARREYWTRYTCGPIYILVGRAPSPDGTAP